MGAFMCNSMDVNYTYMQFTYQCNGLPFVTLTKWCHIANIQLHICVLHVTGIMDCFYLLHHCLFFMDATMYNHQQTES